MLEIQGSDGKWSAKSYWLEENKIAFIEYIGDFDDRAVIELNQFVAENYLEKGNPPVHNIIDATQLGSFPKNLSALREGSSYSVHHPNTGWILLVGFGSNPILKFLSSAVGQVLGIKFKQVETLEDAKSILRRVDNTLAQLA